LFCFVLTEYTAIVKLANGQSITVNLNGTAEYQDSIHKIEDQYKSEVVHVDLDLAVSGNANERLTANNDESSSSSHFSNNSSSAAVDADSMNSMSHSYKARSDPLPLLQRSHWQNPITTTPSTPSINTAGRVAMSNTLPNGATSNNMPNGIAGSPENEPVTHKILNRVVGQARGPGDYVLSDVLGNRLRKLESYSSATRSKLKIPVGILVCIFVCMVTLREKCIYIYIYIIHMSAFAL